MFSLCLSIYWGGGYGVPQSVVPTPFPASGLMSFLGGYPLVLSKVLFLVLLEGTPVRTGRRYPHNKTVGYPVDRTGQGVPPGTGDVTPRAVRLLRSRRRTFLFVSSFIMVTFLVSFQSEFYVQRTTEKIFSWTISQNWIFFRQGIFSFSVPLNNSLFYDQGCSRTYKFIKQIIFSAKMETILVDLEEH